MLYLAAAYIGTTVCSLDRLLAPPSPALRPASNSSPLTPRVLPRRRAVGSASGFRASAPWQRNTYSSPRSPVHIGKNGSMMHGPVHCHLGRRCRSKQTKSPRLLEAVPRTAPVCLCASESCNLPTTENRAHSHTHSNALDECSTLTESTLCKGLLQQAEAASLFRLRMDKWAKSPHGAD